jgi:hypothetical protein
VADSHAWIVVEKFVLTKDVRGVKR